jgi:hypothetical protein
LTHQPRFLQNQEASPLLQLPGEIRNKIYQYALGGHHIYLNEHQPSFKRLIIRGVDGKQTSKGDLFALGYTCRQTHSESAILLFSLNEFFGYFWSRFEVQRCELFSPSQRNAVRNISVTICCFRHFKGSEMIIVDTFGGLERITLVAAAGQNNVNLQGDAVNIVRIKRELFQLFGREMEVILKTRDTLYK